MSLLVMLVILYILLVYNIADIDGYIQYCWVNSSLCCVIAGLLRSLIHYSTAALPANWLVIHVAVVRVAGSTGVIAGSAV